jgi:hypothetical protein
MSELDYIGGNDLVTYNDPLNNIHSGGFSVESIMMRAGMSPISTLNGGILNGPEGFIGGGDDSRVSDLFGAGLVVPAHLLSYNNRIGGGKYKEVEHDDSDSEDSVIDDDLHDRLLELVKEHKAKEVTISKKKMTRKMRKTGYKKRATKRRK